MSWHGTRRTSMLASMRPKGSQTSILESLCATYRFRALFFATAVRILLA